MDVVTLAAAKANTAKQIEEALSGGGAVAGKSAYQIAVDEGFSGTEEEWLESLHGADGTNGTDGASAYDIAVDNGFSGTEQEWLASLHGADGNDGADGAVFIAPTEASSTSAAAYAVGDQLILSGVLYTVTAAIAIGDTITVGTNVTASNKLTGQIKSINAEIGDLTNLTTTVKTNLVAAINEAAQSGGSGGSGGSGITELIEAGTDTTFSAQIDKFYSPLSQLIDEQLINTFVTYGNTIYRYINHTNDRYIYSCVTTDDRDAYGNVFYIDRVIVKSSGSKFYDTTVNGTTHTVNELTNASMSSEDAMGLYMQASQGGLSGVEILAHVEGAANLSFSDALESIATQLQSVNVGEYFDDVFFEMTEIDQSTNEVVTYNMKLVEVIRNSNQEVYGYFFVGAYVYNTTHNARHVHEYYFESGNNRVFDDGSNQNYSSWSCPEGTSITVYRRK